jgi:programmed cell death protein 5
MDIEEIRKKKLAELKSQMETDEKQKAQVEQQDQMVDSLLRRIMTADAKARLKNIELANPTLAQQVISLLIQLYQAGQISVVTDKQLVMILKKLSGKKREMKIRRK